MHEHTIGMKFRMGVFCVLSVSLAWGQAKPDTAGSGNDDDQATESARGTVPMDAAVLTIRGFCPKKSAAEKVGDAQSCVTVITRSEFEKLAAAIRPNLSVSVKQQLASLYPRLLVMSQKAEELGIDKMPPYDQMIAFSRMQILAQGLTQRLQQQSPISDEEIAEYYRGHVEDFDEYSMDRLFIPIDKQPGSSDNKQALGETRNSQLELTELAEALQERAASGEDFPQLQKEAFAAAGVRVASPTTSMGVVRRSQLSGNQSEILALKVGEVTKVITDAGGHYIYKLEAKDRIPLDQAKSEIRRTLESQRGQEELDKIQHSYSVETSDAYFAVKK